MSERHNFSYPDYNHEADVTTELLQDDMLTACDFLDAVLDLPQTRSLKFARAHSSVDDAAQLTIDRQYLYDNKGVLTSVEIHYEQARLGDIESYGVSIAKTGLFADARPTRAVTTTYELRRSSERALDGSVRSEYRIDSHDSKLESIRPTVRPIMVGDIAEICDACSDIVRDAS